MAAQCSCKVMGEVRDVNRRGVTSSCMRYKDTSCCFIGAYYARLIKSSEIPLI